MLKELASGLEPDTVTCFQFTKYWIANYYVNSKNVVVPSLKLGRFYYNIHSKYIAVPGLR